MNTQEAGLHDQIIANVEVISAEITDLKTLFDQIKVAATGGDTAALGALLEKAEVKANELYANNAALAAISHNALTQRDAPK